jgi:hypothetical protein
MWWWLHKRLLDETVDQFGGLVGVTVYLAGAVAGTLLLVTALLGHGPLRLLAIGVIAVAFVAVAYDELTS